MGKSSRKCILCPSHTYEYCPNCKDNKVVEPWRLLFDKETCRDAYHIISEFAFGRLSANEAKRELDKINVPNKEEMQPALRKNLEDLYSQASVREVITADPEEDYKRSSIPSYMSDNMDDPDPTNARRRRRMYSPDND